MYESIYKNDELENEMSLDMSYFWYSDVWKDSFNPLPTSMQGSSNIRPDSTDSPIPCKQAPVCHVAI